MRILLTNDDGLAAPGIVALFNALKSGVEGHSGALHGATDILPVAPLTVQSATSHGVTFHEPLMIRTMQVAEGMTGVAVDGRPADCVKLAISSIWPERFPESKRPDVLISGMNAGANCGVNVIYSGTVAAAIEAAFLGVPSIAVSLTLGRGAPKFDVAARYARHALERILARGLPDRHECLSINIPVTETDGPMPQIRVCPMNTHGLIDQYERRTSPGGDVYYWAAGHGLDFHATEYGSDVELLKAGCITVTPLHYDLTRHNRLEPWRARLEG